MTVFEHKLRHHQVDYDLVVDTKEGNVPHVEVKMALDQETIAELFEKAFHGYCPVCRLNPINPAEVICCECYEEARLYHQGQCGCDNIEAY
jgi:hypothetical protein